ncbi:hypothetical protein OXYTRIMIC_434 [Oxytricha trifallax]|uniref:Transmembrane protein n=1 Tax=Oxytricha trifallax TaxID=1172189 RepID=A0A073I0B0_9SPIT|nr:hypothetical protein OXYTRIMIC_434 [Oxytricha trifallax]
MQELSENIYETPTQNTKHQNGQCYYSDQDSTTIKSTKQSPPYKRQIFPRKNQGFKSNKENSLNEEVQSEEEHSYKQKASKLHNQFQKQDKYHEEDDQPDSAQEEVDKMFKDTKNQQIKQLLRNQNSHPQQSSLYNSIALQIMKAILIVIALISSLTYTIQWIASLI